jgi:hypothetical protein
MIRVIGISLCLIACGTRSKRPLALFDKAATQVSEAQTPHEIIADFCSRVMYGDYIGGGRIQMCARSSHDFRGIRNRLRHSTDRCSTRHPLAMQRFATGANWRAIASISRACP